MTDDAEYFEKRPARNFRARIATEAEAAAAGVRPGKIGVAYVSRQATMLGIPPIVIASAKKDPSRLTLMQDRRVRDVYSWHVQRQAADAARRAAAAAERLTLGLELSRRRSPARG